MTTGRVDAIGFENRPAKTDMPIENKKVRKFDAELQGLLTGNPPVQLAALPDIGNFLNGSKGAGHATTQV